MCVHVCACFSVRVRVVFARVCNALVSACVAVRARVSASVRVRACFCFEICAATEPPTRNSPCCMLHRSRPVATAARRHLARGVRVCGFVLRCTRCSALHAASGVAALVRASHDSDRVGPRPLHSRLSRCAGTPRWWAARPLLLRTSDLHEAGPALQQSAAGPSAVLATGGSATVARRGEPATMAVGASGQLVPLCSDPPMTSKRRPRPWCSTLPVPKVPGPAGRPECCRPGPSSAMAGPGSAGPGGFLGREVPALARPNCPVATLVARPCLQPLAAAMAVGFGSLP